MIEVFDEHQGQGEHVSRLLVQHPGALFLRHRDAEVRRRHPHQRYLRNSRGIHAQSRLQADNLECASQHLLSDFLHSLPLFHRGWLELERNLHLGRHQFYVVVNMQKAPIDIVHVGGTAHEPIHQVRGIAHELVEDRGRAPAESGAG